MKPIAIVSGSFEKTLNNIRTSEDIEKIIVSQRKIIMKDGRVFIIITQPQDADGYEFSDYTIHGYTCPTQETIEAVITRTR